MIYRLIKQIYNILININIKYIYFYSKMIIDDVIWEIINNNFCSFKTK
jgi:hypothetical protein